MSYLIDTDVLSLLSRQRVPVKLLRWLAAHDHELFVSVLSFAELQHGVNEAPPAHQKDLSEWIKETRHLFASATEELAEPVLVRWKQLLAELKVRKRTMSCEDSLIAATALFYGHTVVTQNQRHFEPAGVGILNPLA